ncbi:uracil-DNA glycosylase, family 4 [Hyphomonas neptunium ATCC 15444]|uniref:Type-4 uracil-DNA glycosylase n=3 Tax=Hyphomonas TaxID=85 RepID=Q0C0Y4_HYPNA|nr:uracil-DNA glycosylase, family 4 [Hyphomonas neptunium ATCC 15444]KCZ94976.1 uracil-DNA glycosylase [Hyphomonas hirschiana VP5]
MGVAVDAPLVEALLAAAPALPDAPEQAQALEPAPLRKRGARTVADWVREAETIAAGCANLDELTAAAGQFSGSPLRASCENTVVYDGTPGASLLVIGEGPGAQEDRQGKPFVGKAGQLLDKMLAAIGRNRAENALITNVNYWRPPGNRSPEADELAVCRPFVDRFIEVSRPRLIVAAGGIPAVSLLGSREGIMKLRGNEYCYTTPGGYRVPLIPMLHPAYLLRRPQDKSRAWRDLLLIEKRLGELE